MAPIITAAVVTTLFLGGTKGFDPVPGQAWFVLKMFVVIFVLLWFRATWPRLRVDQIMGFAWKPLFGLGIFNIFLIALESTILSYNDNDISSTDMLLMGAINWIITIAILLILVNVFGNKILERPDPVPSPLANMGTEAD